MGRGQLPEDALAYLMPRGSLVTLVAAVHYFYMREYWVIFQESPIVYRYIDWSITVPLQMVEFYLVLHAVDKSISGGMFWRLLLGTVAMLTFGYLVRPVSSMHGWASSWVWQAGVSSFTRSSWA